MRVNDLTAQVKALAGASTADLVGIAPGGAFSAEEFGGLGSCFGPVHAVVVLAQHIVDPVQLVRYHSGGTYQDSRVAASFADALLRDACWRAVEVLRDAGCRAVIARNLRYGVDDPRHRIWYKKAAILAGLGAIGRNNLLLHPQHGPWLMLTTVLTDAALAPDARIDFSPCGDCERCIEACPGGALSAGGFERAKCEAFYARVGASPSGPVRISPCGPINCEECMRACPVGAAPPRLDPGAGRR